MFLEEEPDVFGGEPGRASSVNSGVARRRDQSRREATSTRSRRSRLSPPFDDMAAAGLTLPSAGSAPNLGKLPATKPPAAEALPVSPAKRSCHAEAAASELPMATGAPPLPKRALSNHFVPGASPEEEILLKIFCMVRHAPVSSRESPSPRSPCTRAHNFTPSHALSPARWACAEEFDRVRQLRAPLRERREARRRRHLLLGRLPVEPRVSRPERHGADVARRARWRRMMARASAWEHGA